MTEERHSGMENAGSAVQPAAHSTPADVVRMSG